MPEDTLTVRVDPSNSFDVLQRLGGASDRLGQSGARLGDGFIRGERVVRTATGNIAASLLSVNDAASVAVVAMQGLERVFAIGLLPTVAVAAAVAAFEVFHKQIEKTREASDELGKALGKSVGLEVQGSVESLGSEIDTLRDKMEKLRKEANSPTSRFMKLFGGGEDSEAASLRRAEHGRPEQLPATKDQQQLIQGEQRLRELASARADKEVKIAEAKRDQNKIGQLELTYEDQRAKLFQGAFKAGLNMVDLMKRLVALQITLTHEIEKETSARIQSRQGDILKQQQDTAKQATDFFTDLGSGKFAKDFATKQQTDFQQQAGRDLAKRIEEGQQKGFFQDPLSQAALKEARRISDRAGTSVTDLANTDFSNLLELSKYDFSGLQPLSGLTLSIQ